MASPINVGFDLVEGATAIIPLNRWGLTAYTLQVATGDVNVEGTITQLNRRNTLTGVPNAPVWDELNDDEGNALTGVTDLHRVNGYALEAVRITAAGGAAAGRFMQQGIVD